MDDSDKKRFSQIITGLAEDCSAQITSAGLFMRFEALKQFTIGQVESAVIRVMKSNVYTKMPTTGTILNAIQGAVGDRAEYQYTVVLRAIRQLGNSGHPKFKDPITQAIVDTRFGWSKICGILDKDMEFFARDFKSAYVTYEKSNHIMIGDCGQHKDLIGLVKLKPITGGKP